MSFYATVGDQRITSGSLLMPYYGSWAADFDVPTPEAITGAVQVTIGGLTLQGSTYRSAAFAGARSARLVGGTGGWRHQLTGRAYGPGVTASMVLRDAAAELGETVNVVVDTPLGTNYVRPAVSGGALLRMLAGQLWYIDQAGVTQVVARRPSAVVSSAFTVIDRAGDEGMLDIATESPEEWMPGNTFSGPTVTVPQTISSTVFILDNDGTMRLRVLTVGAVDET